MDVLSMLGTIRALNAIVINVAVLMGMAGSPRPMVLNTGFLSSSAVLYGYMDPSEQTP